MDTNLFAESAVPSAPKLSPTAEREKLVGMAAVVPARNLRTCKHACIHASVRTNIGFVNQLKPNTNLACERYTMVTHRTQIKERRMAHGPTLSKRSSAYVHSVRFMA